MRFLDAFYNPAPPTPGRFNTPKLFGVSVLLKNEKDEFPWTGYVFANSESEAVEFVSSRTGGCVTEVLYICEHIPVAGEILPARLTRRITT